MVHKTYMMAIAAAILAGLSSADNQAHSRVADVNGTPTMIVNAKPFLIVGAQCDIWRSTRQDGKTLAFFDGYKAMNATTVSVGVPWAKIETAEGQYDFAFMDWFIEQAQARGLKLIINLFNSNICGKVEEQAGSSVYPGYTPAYMLSQPDKYQRMILPTTWKYAAGGPPMCPNDPNTLERERKYVVQVAEHLREFDKAGTVIMLQLDNEFYYQQWEGERPKDEKTIRCHCPYCEKLFDPAKFKNEEDFMFHSFAGYVRQLTDSMTAAYKIPIYINSPWWQPYIIPIFLDNCPNLSFVGIDGIMSPVEPNMLSRSQLSRNMPFAAENPTEQADTRRNIDVLPYYTVIGRMGLGNLLWECGPPWTVVDDAEARERYGKALYPLKNALGPIAEARGTKRLFGWYALHNGHFFIREGTTTRISEDDKLCVEVGGSKIDVSDTAAGVGVLLNEQELLIATSKANLAIHRAGFAKAESGRYVGERFERTADFKTGVTQDAVTANIAEASVVRFTFSGVAQ